MGDPRTLYLLPPCSDAGEGRLWCEDPMTCEDFEGPHDECECGGKGRKPTRYVRAELPPLGEH